MDDTTDSPSLLDYLKVGSTTATGILRALNKPKTTAPSGTTNWTVIAGIGAAVLGILLLVMLAGRK